MHLDPNGDVDALDGAFIPTPRGVAIDPQISAADAVVLATEATPSDVATARGLPERIIYGPLDSEARLAWKVEVVGSLVEAWLVIVDAHSGEIIGQIDLVKDANVATAGRDVFGQNRALNVWQQGGTFSLVDTSKAMYDPTSTPPSPDSTRGGIVILDAANQAPDNEGRIQLSVVTSNNPSSWLADGVSASYGLSETYDYFLDRHQRNSLDGNGGTMLAVVRFDRNFQNAFWNGQLMVFGDALPYAGALDVVGHELTHGVTETSANLVYMNQPGALNEAMSDIFGEMVESRTQGQQDWLKGRQLGDPIQNYADPNSIEIVPGSGRVLPSKWSEFLGTNDPLLDRLQNRDNGGVHINSAIINHCFYLLAEGMNGAIGVRDAERIFYRALTVHLVANSQFVDARLAAILSAREIFGEQSTQAQRTAEAFDMVEIVDGNPTPEPPDFPAVGGNDATLFGYFEPSVNAFLLGRREEALGDTAGGTQLAQVTAIALSRPSVTGDGSIGVFVSADNDVCLVNVDGTIEPQTGAPEICLGLAGSVNSVAMSPDGERFGFVLLDAAGEPDNVITVIDLGLSNPVQFPLRSPAIDGGGLNSVLFADAMDFTADGRFLAYDALNTFQLLNGQAIEVWSIYALDLETDTTLVLLAPQPGVDFGFPSFSQTSDNYLTLDAVSSATQQSTVLTVNLTTGERRPIATVAGLGVPGYTGDDSAIVYAAADPGTNTGFSLVRQPLAADRISPSGQPSRWLQDGDIGVIYRRGSFAGPPSPTPTMPFVSPTPTIALPTPTRRQPTPTRPPISACVGDCSEDGSVTVSELVRGVSIALGRQLVDVCPDFDVNRDGTVSISELIRAVNSALFGCL